MAPSFLLHPPPHGRAHVDPPFFPLSARATEMILLKTNVGRCSSSSRHSPLGCARAQAPPPLLHHPCFRLTGCHHRRPLLCVGFCLSATAVRNFSVSAASEPFFPQLRPPSPVSPPCSSRSSPTSPLTPSPVRTPPRVTTPRCSSASPSPHRAGGSHPSLTCPTPPRDPTGACRQHLAADELRAVTAPRAHPARAPRFPAVGRLLGCSPRPDRGPALCTALKICFQFNKISNISSNFQNL
jgi:hypothetical protein